METVKLFYSWQMDRPTPVCRDFIRIALEAATEILAAEGIVLEVDSGTEGVAGTPPVTETILAKIRACHLFLADMTFVAAAGEKLIPNPNVMAEYGYALHAKGSHRILLVMNTAYGPPDNLPFDLRHLRHPEGYDIAPEATDGPRRAARSDLGRKLATYIGIAARELDKAAVQTAVEQREILAKEWWGSVQARTHNDKPALIADPSALVHVVPWAALGGEGLDPRVVRGSRGLLRLRDGATEGADGHQWWARGPRREVDNLPNPIGQWYARLLQPGVVEFDRTLGERIDDDPTIVVKGTRIEWLIVEAADRGLELANALQLAGPFAIGVVLDGLGDLEFDGKRRTGRFNTASLILPVTHVPSGAIETGDHMRRAFDQLWMSVGFADGSPSYAQPRWAGYTE